MPEGMGTAPRSRDPSRLTQSLDQLLQAGARECVALLREEQRVLRLALFLLEVLPERPRGRPVETDGAALIALTEHRRTPSAEIHVLEPEVTQLGGAHAGIEQEKENRFVTAGISAPSGCSEQGVHL